MITMNKARITNINKIKKMINKLDKSNINFYSEFNDNIFYYVVSGRCFLVKKNYEIQTVIIIKSLCKEIVYIPVNNKGISFFKLLFLLTKKLFVDEYYLKLKYKKLNAVKYKEYFPYSIVEDIKIMQVSTDITPFNDCCNLQDVKFRIMELNKDEGVRVELQNKIFSDIKGRRELKIEEVKREEVKPGFIKNMCYIIEINGYPAGYGQILLLDGNHYLVNFGIISEFRQHGLGYHFLNHILYDCYEKGLNTIFLSVDNNNYNAVKLYEKAGFKEVYNMLTIKM